MDSSIIGLSLVIITIGAVLAWAVDIEVTGFDINVAGVIRQELDRLRVLRSY